MFGSIMGSGMVRVAWEEAAMGYVGAREEGRREGGPN